MLKRLSAREQIAILLDDYSLAIRNAFLEVVAEIVSRVTLRLVVERLDKGDITGAIAALHIERHAFNPVLDKIAEAYNVGGVLTADNLPLREPTGHRLVFRFDVRNPAAEQWLREHSSQLVTNIVDDQRSAVRAALTEGLSLGANPRSTALDIIGRTSRVSGRREGGIIGLTGQQSQAVSNARQRLLSGDPTQMREYLGLTRRDKRFDKTVLAAIEAEKPVPADMVARITGRYADRLLQLRGETLARTETMTALNVAADQAMDQAIAAGHVSAAEVIDIWHSAGDDRVRHTHQVLNRQAVAHNTGFRSPSGVTLRYPGDPLAPAFETIGCRCWREMKIDYLAKYVRPN
jgi:hypothetical protein